MTVDMSGPQTGWICPKCGRVMAPYIDHCLFCQVNHIHSYEGTVDDTVFEPGGTIRPRTTLDGPA